MWTVKTTVICANGRRITSGIRCESFKEAQYVANALQDWCGYRHTRIVARMNGIEVDMCDLDAVIVQMDAARREVEAADNEAKAA